MEWNKFNEDSNLTRVLIGLLGEFYKWNLKVSAFPSSTFAFGKKVNFPYKNYIVQK